MSEFFPFGARATMRTSFSASVLFVVLFAVVPGVAVLVLSFTDIRSIPYIPVNWIGFDNYIEFFSAAKLGYNVQALTNTLVFAFAVTIFQKLPDLWRRVDRLEKKLGKTEEA